MRPIDGDALIAWIKESQQMTSKMNSIICKIKTMPVTDRPQGEWMCRMINPINAYFECSECGYKGGTKRYNFCPNCGARMKGVDDE